MNGKWIRWMAYGLAALPAVVPLWMIFLYAVDCPHWDQWDTNLAGLYVRAADGQLSLWDFTAQHNEHRIFVPRTVSFALNILTKWDTRGEMLLSWVVVCLTSAGVLWLARQTIGRGTIDGMVIFLWFLSNLMLFSPRQQENWLWGIGLMNVMPVFFIVSAMAVLHTRLGRWVRVVVAMILCAGAMFSSGNGVLAFPLVGLVLAWSHSKEQFKGKRDLLAGWIVGFVLSAGMFAWGYKLPPVAKGLENKVVTFGERVHYLLSFLGNQFYSLLELSWKPGSTVAGSITLCLLLVAMGCLLFLWLRYKQVQLVSMALPWCVLMLFSVLSALIAAVFRPNLGIENAVSSRYVTITLYQYVALIFLVPLLCRDLSRRYPALNLRGTSLPVGRTWAQLPLVFATVLIVCYVHTISQGFVNAELTYYGRLKTKAALMLVNVLPNNPRLASGVYPKVAELRELANRLNELGYLRPGLVKSGDALTRLNHEFDGMDGTKYGAFERLAETGPNIISAAGWAMCPRRQCPVDAIVLTHRNDENQEAIFALSEGITRRPDLTRRFNNSGYELCGWVISFEMGTLPDHVKTVSISAWAIDAESGTFRPLPGKMNLVASAAPTR